MGFVPKFRGLTVTRDGKTHTYCAMVSRNEICPVCYPKDGSKGVPCKGRESRYCMADKCKRCEYYGHHGWACKQAKTATGGKLIEKKQE